MSNVIGNYLNNGYLNNSIDVKNLPRTGIKNNDFHIERLVINNGKPIYENSLIIFNISFRNEIPIDELVIGFSISDILSNTLIECRSTATYKELNLGNPDIRNITVAFNPLLKSGIYNLNLGARCAKGFLEYIPGVATIEILSANKTTEYEAWNKPTDGVIITNSSWNLEYE